MTLFHMVTQAVPFEGMDTATHMRLMLVSSPHLQSASAVSASIT